MGDNDGEKDVAENSALSNYIYVNSGGRQFELTETFVPEVDEVIGRRFGDSLADALRRYGQRGVPVLIRKNGKSCLLYTKTMLRQQ